MARIIRVDKVHGVGFQLLGGVRFHLLRDVRGIILDLFGVRIKMVFYPGMRRLLFANDWHERPPWNNIIVECGSFHLIIGHAYSGYLANG